MACLDLHGRDCLVVGGGRVATEKVQGLLECDAKVTVVAPQMDDELWGLPVSKILRAFEPEDAADRFLVIALCSFILPAVVRRDPIVVGVSTGGASPALAQRIRDDIADVVGPQHAELALLLQALRPWAKRELPTYEARRDYFQRVVEEALA